ncbi:MAG: phosphomannose isomerase type II C-terminal cupin domain [Alphaproteobacteria bacterium]|nr:phosphomannose isomerase type II C-terminal cupin domain [Alphaproteobacteria bacterium]
MANKYQIGDKDTRPWGTWEVLSCGENFCIKKIIVNPQAKLSLQLHHHRSEHWIITKGIASVALGDSILEKKPFEHVYIPQETKHRMTNPGSQPLEFIEVQTGEILDENDIIRFEDIYNRVNQQK